MTLPKDDYVEMKPRFKASFYGAAGVGKTTAAIQFPNCYVIDTEGATRYTKYKTILESLNSSSYKTRDFDEILSIVKNLLTTNHEFKTLVIDSMTVIYSDLLTEAEAKVGSDYGANYKEADKKIKQLLNLIERLDMNVILIAHSKKEYGEKTEILGHTFDCYKKMDYFSDLLLEISKRGKRHVATVKKTWIDGFPPDDVFTFSYDEIVSRYDKEILEKQLVPVVMASTERLEKLNKLIELLSIQNDTIRKWIKKDKANSLKEMKAESIEKCIQFLETKINE